LLLWATIPSQFGCFVYLVEAGRIASVKGKLFDSLKEHFIMAALKKSEHSYKCCFVPMCTKTTVSTPEKIFFNVPSTVDVRKQWFDAAHREDKVSAKTKCFACEDHFIVSN